MNLGQLLDYINFVCAKEKVGYTYTNEAFNLTLPIVQDDVYLSLRPNYERNQEISNAFSDIKVYMGDVTAPLRIDSNGIAIAPTDFYYHSSMTYKDVIGKEMFYRDVVILSDSQFTHRLSSRMMRPSKEYPIAVYRNGWIQFAPIDLSLVNFSYLKNPAKPFFDYYINTDGDSVYLLPNQRYPLQDGEVYSDGVTIGTSTTHPMVTSQSVEISRDTYIQYFIINRLLERAGIHISYPDMVQYSQLLKQASVQRQTN